MFLNNFQAKTLKKQFNVENICDFTQKNNNSGCYLVRHKNSI